MRTGLWRWCCPDSREANLFLVVTAHPASTASRKCRRMHTQKQNWTSKKPTSCLHLRVLKKEGSWGRRGTIWLNLRLTLLGYPKTDEDGKGVQIGTFTTSFKLKTEIKEHFLLQCVNHASCAYAPNPDCLYLALIRLSSSGPSVP